MLWERLTFSDRFEFVDQKKIVHVVMDDVVDRKKIAADEWYHELKQTDIGVQRVKNWSQYDGHLGDGDIFISADVDEVMARLLAALGMDEPPAYDVAADPLALAAL